MSASVIESFRRIVVKVGSSLLIGSDDKLNRPWLDALAGDVAGLHASGCEMLIVSSGSIAIGSRILGIEKRRARLEELQAAAATGQVQLAHAWQESLAGHGITAAQVLLTPGDTEDRRRFLNARSTLARLLDHRAVPVINENDTVATEEIRYGDNDRLAARVAQLVMADALLLLSDVDGLYSADPGKDPAAEHVAVVDRVGEREIASAGETRSDIGSGGMATKVQAARIATRAGCATIIASGVKEHPIRALQEGARCTRFLAADTPAAARKQWLAGKLAVRGTVIADRGAIIALQQGKSLLPVGILSVDGRFERGDVVAISDQDGVELGRGLIEYASDEAARLRGCQSADIEGILGYRGRAVLIHRDELVLFANDL